MNAHSFTRRDFAKLTVAAAALPTTLGAAEAGKKRALKKGYMVQTFPGGGKLPMLEKFKMLKKAGYDGVEPGFGMDANEVLKAREATGLEIPSVSCGGPARKFANPDPAARGKAVEELQTALREAKRYGAKTILVVPGGVDEKTPYDANYERTQECIRKCVPLAEELGITMAVENVWNNFLLSPLEAARYVDEFKSPFVGWYFDVGNVMFLGWPEQWIRILGKRIKSVHLKEYSRKKLMTEGKAAGFAIEFLEGDNDWPAIMKALDDIGYRGWCTVEPAWRPPNVEPATRVRQISERMDKILAS